MNYIACADLHIRSNRPQFRKDDYWITVCSKFKQIINIANKHKADIIVAGDFFDSTKVGFKVVNTILEHIKKLKGEMLVVAGQHDQAYHQHSLVASPLQILIHAGVATLLDREKPYFDGKKNIYGCSFGEDPIEPETENNILVIHKSITPKEPPFFLTDALSMKEAISTWPGYGLIIAGDYHLPFRGSMNNTLLVNCGPMMRQSIDQMKIEPSVWFIGKTFRQIKLRVAPAESVFALEKIKDKEESLFSKELEELVETLKSESDKPDYKETVNLLMDESDVSYETRNKIDSILKSVE